MRLVVQRVSQASVTSTLNETTTTSQISTGLLALVGFEKSDTESDARAAAQQLLKLRLFPDANTTSPRATLNIKDANKELLLVSQFTLSAALKSGRVSFHKAMGADDAQGMWEMFIAECRESGIEVRTGVFGAFMQVHSVNDGPFTRPPLADQVSVPPDRSFGDVLLSTMDEATPLIRSSQSAIGLTLIHESYVTTMPLPDPFCQPPNTLALITTNKPPPPSLLQTLDLPPLPKPSIPRLQHLPNGYTLTFPNFAVTANSSVVLATTSTPPIVKPGTTVIALLVALSKATIPSFLRAVDNLGNSLDQQEATSLTEKHATEVEKIWRIRREVSRLRRHGVCLRHLLRGLQASESTIRSLQIGLDTLSLIRDSAHAALELLLALQNNRMQETMQTLAVVTTIFVPLTFLAGIEGMNFANQPELNWGWSYGAFWLLVVVLIVGQIIFFRRKGWI